LESPSPVDLPWSISVLRVYNRPIILEGANMSDQALDTATHRLAVSLFGRFDTWLDDQPLGGFEYNKVRALLAYLAVETGHPQPRGHLCALFWPDLSESAARQNLSQALTRLRQALGDKQAATPFLLTTTESVRLNPAVQNKLLLAMRAHDEHIQA
jgi:DNA-binding SARP family transcriptional activator